eukprot:14094574-Alexandrium_andersonii.AAC.1
MTRSKAKPVKLRYGLWHPGSVMARYASVEITVFRQRAFSPKAAKAKYPGALAVGITAQHESQQNMLR